MSESEVGAAQLIATVKVVGESGIGGSENLGHLFHCGIGKDNFGVGFLCLYIYIALGFSFCFLQVQILENHWSKLLGLSIENVFETAVINQ